MIVAWDHSGFARTPENSPENNPENNNAVARLGATTLNQQD
jgi:hypothetical protein